MCNMMAYSENVDSASGRKTHHLHTGILITGCQWALWPCMYQCMTAFSVHRIRAIFEEHDVDKSSCLDLREAKQCLFILTGATKNAGRSDAEL